MSQNVVTMPSTFVLLLCVASAACIGIVAATTPQLGDIVQRGDSQWRVRVVRVQLLGSFSLRHRHQHWQPTQLTFQDEFTGTALNTSLWNVYNNHTHGPKEYELYMADEVYLSNGSVCNSLLAMGYSMSWPFIGILPPFCCCTQVTWCCGLASERQCMAARYSYRHTHARIKAA